MDWAPHFETMTGASTQTSPYPLLKENHAHLEFALSKPIIHITNYCDMIDDYANQYFELITGNQNDDDSQNLRDIKEVKYDYDKDVKCEEINIEKSYFDSSLKENFSSAFLSQFNANFSKDERAYHCTFESPCKSEMNSFIPHLNEEDSLMGHCSSGCIEYLLDSILEFSYTNHISCHLQGPFKFIKHNLYANSTLCSNNF